MQLLFSYFPAPQTITSNLPQSMSPWSIESKSYRTSAFSQSDNISFGVSLASSPSLSLRTRAKANTDVSGQRALLSSRDSKQFFKTQNNFSLMSKSVNTYICELGRPCGGKLWPRSWIRRKAGKLCFFCFPAVNWLTCEFTQPCHQIGWRVFYKPS